MKTHQILACFALTFVVMASSTRSVSADFGLAYIGPGGGLAGIGALIALVTAIIVAIFGFLWYPIKRLLRKKDRSNEQD